MKCNQCVSKKKKNDISIYTDEAKRINVNIGKGLFTLAACDCIESVTFVNMLN